jgi:hypothetical protein
MKEDFDFLIGSWTVHNRYLKERLRGSNEWIEFDATVEARYLLDGLANIDEYRALRNGTPVIGTTLRLYNPRTSEWTIHWADTVNPGVLLPPMVGRFRDDCGEFYGDEQVNGRRVLCRFRWFRAPRWEQAFSDDEGKTWETNWIMTFTRKEDR